MKTLLTITTCNQLKFTKLCDKSLPDLENVDILYIDDASKDGTVDYLDSKDRDTIYKQNGVGLTDSWNIAYRIFKNLNYDALFISNNDVIFNESSIINMIEALREYPLVCPLSSRSGAGHNHTYQDVNKYYKIPNSIDRDPDKHKDLLSILENNIVEMDRFNGFFFGVNRDIIKCQSDEKHLFKPKFPQSGQEGDLQNRLIKKPVVCTGAFIFHFKGVTAPNIGTINGQDKRNLPETIEGYHA